MDFNRLAGQHPARQISLTPSGQQLRSCKPSPHTVLSHWSRPDKSGSSSEGRPSVSTVMQPAPGRGGRGRRRSAGQRSRPGRQGNRRARSPTSSLSAEQRGGRGSGPKQVEEKHTRPTRGPHRRGAAKDATYPQIPVSLSAFNHFLFPSTRRDQSTGTGLFHYKWLFTAGVTPFYNSV